MEGGNGTIGGIGKFAGVESTLANSSVPATVAGSVPLPKKVPPAPLLPTDSTTTGVRVESRISSLVSPPEPMAGLSPRVSTMMAANTPSARSSRLSAVGGEGGDQGGGKPGVVR